MILRLNGKLLPAEIIFLIRRNQLRFSASVDVVVKKEAVNPKRMQREAAKQIASAGIGTKSQQALQLQREENKLV